jgi:hypothetical protein
MELFAVSVLPSAIVKVALAVGCVIVTLFMVVAVAAPCKSSAKSGLI